MNLVLSEMLTHLGHPVPAPCPKKAWLKRQSVAFMFESLMQQVWQVLPVIPMCITVLSESQHCCFEPDCIYHHLYQRVLFLAVGLFIYHLTYVSSIECSLWDFFDYWQGVYLTSPSRRTVPKLWMTSSARSEWSESHTRPMVMISGEFIRTRRMRSFSPQLPCRWEKGFIKLFHTGA